VQKSTIASYRVRCVVGGRVKSISVGIFSHACQRKEGTRDVAHPEATRGGEMCSTQIWHRTDLRGRAVARIVAAREVVARDSADAVAEVCHHRGWIAGVSASHGISQASRPGGYTALKADGRGEIGRRGRPADAREVCFLARGRASGAKDSHAAVGTVGAKRTRVRALNNRAGPAVLAKAVRTCASALAAASADAFVGA
jgi:hypothetical protein